MLSNIYRFLSVVLLLLSFFQTASLFAQSPNFRHISLRDGLPSGNIQTIFQDSKGFIWFGNDNGLAKHDGYSTISYRHNPNDSNSITQGRVYGIIEYDEQTLYIATSSGLNLFNPATGKAKRILLADSLPMIDQGHDLFLQDNHSLWIATNQGLYLLDPSTVNDTTPKMEFFKAPQAIDKQTSSRISIAIDSLNNLWMGSGAGLFKFDLETKSFVGLGNHKDNVSQILQGEIWSVFYTSNKDLLITSTKGLAILKNGSTVIEEVEELGEFGIEDLRAASFQSITEDKKGNIWLGTSLLGAIQWNLKSGEVSYYRYKKRSNTIASDDVHYIFPDREGNIWFGHHYAGASMMYKNSWNYKINIPKPQLPPTDTMNNIQHVVMDKDSLLWGITTNAVIKDLGGESQQYFFLDNSILPQTDVAFIFQKIFHLVDGKFYILGSENRKEYTPRIVVFDVQEKKDKFYFMEKPEGFKPSIIQPVVHENVLYGGNFDSGTYYKIDLKSEKVELIDLNTEIEVNEQILSITHPQFVHENELYTHHYLINLNKNETEISTFVTNLNSGEIRTTDKIIKDPIKGFSPPLASSYENGVIYLRSSSGLIRIDYIDKSYKVLFENDMSMLREGSPFMAEDKKGYLWINKLTGLTRADPLTETIEFFEIPSDEYTTKNAPSSTLLNGEIIFPDVGSYIRFDPSDLRSSTSNHQTIITTIRAGSYTYDVLYNTKEPEIESSQNTITVSFTGLNMRTPTSTHYRYRILGTENMEWNPVGTQRSVFIPNLPTGDYTFEVQSGNQYGNFNQQSASISFSVLPPWWNTVPAYLLYLFILIICFYVASRWQRERVIRRERDKNREKELEQSQLIEEAYKNLQAAKDQLVQQEKLASLGQLTAGIAHEIKNPLNFVNNFSELSLELIEESKESLASLSAKISEEDRKKIQETNEILNDIKENLKKVYKHGTRADSIVKSMLQHSRGGSGAIKPTELNTLIEEYSNLAFHGMRAGKNPLNVSIKHELDPEIEKVPLIEEDFTRVVLNLLNNAFDAMRETQELRPPEVTIRTQKTEQHIVIEIEDNGSGIPDELKEKILQPFFTTKKGTEGTGLGLSITHDIIKAHGGRLDIKSEKGEGSTFTIYLKELL